MYISLIITIIVVKILMTVDMLFLELVMILIFICTFAYWFGPALVAAVGSFFSGVIYVAMLVLTWPFVMLFTWKRMKERDQIYDKLEFAKYKKDYSQIDILTEQYEAAEKKVGNIIQAIFIVYIIAITVLFLVYLLR